MNVFIGKALFDFYPSLAHDEELMVIWKDYWRKNNVWFFKEKLPMEQIKNLFDDYVEHLMQEETKALARMQEFADWDENFTFDYDQED